MRLDPPEAARTLTAPSLPQPLDSETAALLRQFLTPMFETATSWRELARALSRRGYGLGFRDGRLVVTDSDNGAALCTGSAVGMPLRQLAARLGRPCLRLNADGRSAELLD